METPFQIISGPALSDMCDYSFGDHHAAMYSNLIGGFMKEANIHNTEFLNKCEGFEGKIMTLYIDNLRLYDRSVEANEGFDTEWVNSMLANNDLLVLCGQLVDNRFIIFSHQEDTCIDENIKIPKNVLGIYAVNAEYETEKLHPFPFGVQRQMTANDNRRQVLTNNVIGDEKVEPAKLLYINCAVDRNEERKDLPIYQTKDWATCRFDVYSMFYPYSQYQAYLNEIKDHKFVACPRGHANCYDTHKIWETLYLRRVPIVRDFPYFRRLLQGFPVLYVKEWSGITEELLEKNDHLYQEAQKMSLRKLDLDVIFNAIVKSYE